MNERLSGLKEPSGDIGMSRDETHLHKELEEIRFIYETLFPGRLLDTHVWWGDAPVHTPEVVGEQEGVSPEHTGISYLGLTQMGNRSSELSAIRLHMMIPGLPTPGELQEDYTPWRQRPWHFRAVFKASPILFEYGKYRVERKQEKERSGKHGFDRLLLSHNQRFKGYSPNRDTNKAPAILIGFHWLEVGGAENLAFDTVRWALESGLRVFVISDRSGPQRAIHKLPNDPNVHFVRTDRYLPRHLYPTFLRQLIIQENIVMTHNHHCTILYECLPAIKAYAPDVVNIDSTHIVEYEDGGYPRISGVWSNFLDMHHVISDDLRRFYADNFKCDNKVKLGRLLLPEAKEQDYIEPRISVGRSHCRVAFVGRMVHQKRPILAVEIMRRLMCWGQKNDIQFSFDLVGEGAYLEALKYMIGHYRMRHVTTLHAADTDVPRLLEKSDIVLMPSANEGLALVCYEAIAAGCVPVTTDVGAQNEIVPDAVLVDRAPYRTVEESVAAVKGLLTDETFRAAVCVEMKEKFDRLRAGPLAKDLLVPLYTKAAQRTAKVQVAQS